MRIYHAKGTRSVRVIWLCEELGVPYEIEVIDFSAEFRNSPEWRRLHPAGKVPVMTDGDLTLFESGAMVDYILDKHGAGGLEPQRGTADHALYRQWCWFAEATFARPLGEIVNHRRVAPEGGEVQFVIDDCRARTSACLGAIEGALEGVDYLVGNTFSAADIMTGYGLMLADLFKILDDRFPRCQAYYAQLSERPGFEVAKAAG